MDADFFEFSFDTDATWRSWRLSPGTAWGDGKERQLFSTLTVVLFHFFCSVFFQSFNLNWNDPQDRRNLYETTAPKHREKTKERQRWEKEGDRSISKDPRKLYTIRDLFLPFRRDGALFTCLFLRTGFPVRKLWWPLSWHRVRRD